MIVALVNAGLMLTTAGAGLAASAWMVRAGEPTNGRVPGSTPSMERLQSHLPLALGNLTVLVLGSTAAMLSLQGAFTTAFPGWIQLVVQVAFVLLVEDVAFYAWHRLLHQNKSLYRRIHRIHHQAHSPVPMEYIYVHPVEWMVGALGPAAALLAIGVWQGHMSAWVVWTYTLVRQLHELDIHSGIPSTWANALPLVGTADHHRMHHAKPTLGNYDSTLRIWDAVFGTRIPE